MPDLRYAQFCPLARAAEILGHRWTLLVIRELLTGPQRFSDLLARLPGLSRSVLAERLTHLEERGVVRRRELPPPTAVAVYELTPVGRGLTPAMQALTRWGVHFLEPPRPGDHAEPAWVRLAAETFAREDASPARRLEIVAEGPDGEVSVRVAGGPQGTRRLAADAPVEASLRGPVPVVLGLMAGRLDVRDAVARGLARLEGDLAAAARLPELFHVAPGILPEDAPQGVEA